MDRMLAGTHFLELKVSGLPAMFSCQDLSRAANRTVHDIAALLDADRILRRTVLVHQLRLATDTKGRAVCFAVLGLQLSNQLTLDLVYGDLTLGQVEEEVLSERARIVDACQSLPMRTSLASIEFAQCAVSTCLNLPFDDGLSRDLQALLCARGHRYGGKLLDRPWQAELPAFPKYEWRPGEFRVRCYLFRERSGFTLRILDRADVAPELRGLRLHLLKRPPQVELAMALERHEYLTDPVEMTIRVGSSIGQSSLTVADFVALRTLAT